MAHRRFRWLRRHGYTVLRLVAALAATIALLHMFNVSPTSLISLSALISSVSLSIGFAMQTVFQGVAAGRVIEVEHLFDIGDKMTINGYTGFVESILTRITILRGLNGEKIPVPNQVILTSIYSIETAPQQ